MFLKPQKFVMGFIGDDSYPGDRDIRLLIWSCTYTISTRLGVEGFPSVLTTTSWTMAVSATLHLQPIRKDEVDKGMRLEKATDLHYDTNRSVCACKFVVRSCLLIQTQQGSNTHIV